MEYQEKILRFQSQLTKTLFDAGIMLLSSTDAAIDGGPVFGFSLHDELARLVDAGLTPDQALATSTRNSAIAMQALNERGTIEGGKQADLLLLNANPFENIANTQQIADVIVRGHWLSNADSNKCSTISSRPIEIT